MKKLVTVFSCFLISLLGICVPANAAVITPSVATGTALSNIIVIALIIAFFLVGFAIGAVLSPSKKAKASNKTEEVEVIKDKPQEKEQVDQASPDDFFNQRNGSPPRNTGNRYYGNFW